jgi:hypothetical protein
MVHDKIKDFDKCDKCSAQGDLQKHIKAVRLIRISFKM